MIIRQAVTELKIRGNTIPYIATIDEIGTIYCILFVPTSYSVTACRNNALAVIAQLETIVTRNMQRVLSVNGDR